MDFRAPIVAVQRNVSATTYLTKNLSDVEQGRRLVIELIGNLGNAVDSYPDWHPILVAPQQDGTAHVSSLSALDVYRENDHTTAFVRGFVTCPYSEESANRLLQAVNQVTGLSAYRLERPLYSDMAHPVVVEADNIELEADGTIRSRDAIAWFVQLSAKEALHAQVAETWWNIRSNLLGSPHGSRSSLFVNQHTGAHMRKILEAMNDSGMYGPIKEVSLGMLSQRKRNAISENLIRAAIKNWDKSSTFVDFEMRGEICKAKFRDTWNDGYEISIRVKIGQYDLFTSGFYYAENDKITYLDPQGKRDIAEKFL